MKKRNPSFLDDWDWKKVEEWLGKAYVVRGYTCPWGYGKEQRSEKCVALFPKITPKSNDFFTCQHKCPCHSYNMKYVVKVARRLLSQRRGQKR